MMQDILLRLFSVAPFLFRRWYLRRLIRAAMFRILNAQMAMPLEEAIDYQLRTNAATVIAGLRLHFMPSAVTALMEEEYARLGLPHLPAPTPPPVPTNS